MTGSLNLTTKDVICLYHALFSRQDMDPDLYEAFLKLQSHVFEHLNLEHIQDLSRYYPELMRRFR